MNLKNLQTTPFVETAFKIFDSKLIIQQFSLYVTLKLRPGGIKMIRFKKGFLLNRVLC